MSKYSDLGLGVDPDAEELHWGVWVERSPKGFFGDIPSSFVVCNNKTARFSKEEALSFVEECNNDPFTKNKYSAREIDTTEDFTVF